MICLVYIVHQDQVISRPRPVTADFYFDAPSFETAAFVAYHHNERHPKALCVIEESTRNFKVYRASKGSVFEDTANSLNIWVKQLEPSKSKPKRK